MFFQEFPGMFRTAVFKKNLSIDVPYFIKEHLWMNISEVRNKHKCNFHYVAMPMMTSQILKSADFTKTQKFRHLKNET